MDVPGIANLVTQTRLAYHLIWTARTKLSAAIQALVLERVCIVRGLSRSQFIDPVL